MQAPHSLTRNISHVLVIPDGHRRRAERAHTRLGDEYKRSARAGLAFIEALQDTVHPSLITFYAIAVRNLYTRSRAEIDHLWEGLEHALETLGSHPDFVKGHLSFRAIGERGYWPPEIGVLVDQLSNRVSPTRSQLTVQFLIAYSGDLDCARAITSWSAVQRPGDYDTLSAVLQHCQFNTTVDLIIRTGSNMRLTDGPFLACRKAEYLLVPGAFSEVEKSRLSQHLAEFLATPAPAAFDVLADAILQRTS